MKISTTKTSPTALNAVRHGILSNQILLPSESEAEYANLLNDLLSEYEPKTATEKVLVQDIANTIWRKKRLLSAERSSISSGLNNTISKPLTLINESSPIQLNLQESTSVRHLLSFSDSELTNYKKTITEAFTAIDDAEEQKDKSTIFDSLPYPIQQRLDELAEWDSLTPETLIPTIADLLHSELKAIASIEAIRQQAYGSACCNIPFDIIARYDSALDRKLLRLLDALMTMQTKRKAREKASASSATA